MPSSRAVIEVALAFRNLDADPADPVSTWPTEAIATALERGGITDWRRLNAEIQADPWGRVARTVEHWVATEPIYGVSPLFTRAVARARRRAEEADRAVVQKELEAHLAASGLTAAEFASALGTSASRFSTYRTGKVVPSAALLVRARRVTERGRA